MDIQPQAKVTKTEYNLFWILGGKKAFITLFLLPLFYIVFSCVLSLLFFYCFSFLPLYWVLPVISLSLICGYLLHWLIERQQCEDWGLHKALSILFNIIIEPITLCYPNWFICLSCYYSLSYLKKIAVVCLCWIFVSMSSKPNLYFFLLCIPRGACLG